jgi:hypothetical protein
MFHTRNLYTEGYWSYRFWPRKSVVRQKYAVTAPTATDGLADTDEVVNFLAVTLNPTLTLAAVASSPSPAFRTGDTTWGSKP